MKKLIQMFALLGALLLGELAFAAGGVVAELVANKVVVVDGKEKLAPAAAAKPGDTLEYSVTYRNNTGAIAKGVVATLPIPGAGVQYVADSGTPRVTEASLDGKTYAPVPLTRVVTLPNGKRETQLVPVSEYRFLRWTLGDLPVGGATKVSARMRLADANSFATTTSP